MKSIDFLKYLSNNPSGVALDVTLAGTGSASAKLHASGKIIVDCSSAQVSKAITIATPVSFKVIDVHTIHGDATACTITVKNGSSAITDAISIANSDKDIDRAGSIDDAYHAFTEDDDDLVITPGTAAFTGRVIIDVEFT